MPGRIELGQEVEILSENVTFESGGVMKVSYRANLLTNTVTMVTITEEEGKVITQGYDLPLNHDTCKTYGDNLISAIQLSGIRLPEVDCLGDNAAHTLTEQS